MMMKNKTVDTEKVVSTATARLSAEVETMRSRSECAMNVFRSTVENLETINKQLQASADRARQFAQKATENAEEAERRIQQNNSVCQKIYEIIGFPQEA